MSNPRSYTKKPVTIRAMQFKLGVTTKADILAFCPTANVGVPVGPNSDHDLDIRWVSIPTLEGDMTVSDGDFIIEGIKGEFYPCKPDIFADSYEDPS